MQQSGFTKQQGAMTDGVRLSGVRDERLTQFLRGVVR